MFSRHRLLFAVSVYCLQPPAFQKDHSDWKILLSSGHWMWFLGYFPLLIGIQSSYQITTVLGASFPPNKEYYQVFLSKMTACAQIWNPPLSRWLLRGFISRKNKRIFLPLTLFSESRSPLGWMNVLYRERTRGCFESVVCSDVICGRRSDVTYSRHFQHDNLRLGFYSKYQIVRILMIFKLHVILYCRSCQYNQDSIYLWKNCILYWIYRITNGWPFKSGLVLLTGYEEYEREIFNCRLGKPLILIRKCPVSFKSHFDTIWTKIKYHHEKFKGFSWNN